MGTPLSMENQIVAAIRRIMRAVDLHSRRLAEEHGLTGPQLATLQAAASLWASPRPASSPERYTSADQP